MKLHEAVQEAVPGARVSSEAPDRRAYSRDLWPRGLIEMQSGLPEREGPGCIVWPETVEHVAALVALARREGLSLVPFGAGSGVCGGAIPTAGQVVVDLKRFADHRVLAGPELDVGAGAMGITLEERLLEAGYTTGHYPSSILCSTVGGWVAARGAGQCSGRYGKIEDMITSAEVVLGTGDVVRAEAHRGGPELLPLLVGSEGTLGIITRVGLRLHPAPRARAFAAHSFPNVELGIETLRALFQEGLRPAVARLYDPLDSALLAPDDKPKVASPPRALKPTAALLRGIARHPALTARLMDAAERSFMSKVTLVLVHEGDEREVADEARRAEAICRARQSTPLGEGPARAWLHHRYHVSYRQMPQFRAGLFIDTMEVSAPWKHLTDVYYAVKRALGEHVLVMAHLSHSYPDGGSIYFTFAGTQHGDESPLEVYDHAWRVALAAALDSGASLSHHHGVGRSKAPRLGEELGSALWVQRALKSAWDPDGILNPGVLLPSSSNADEGVPDPPTQPELDAQSGLVTLPGTMLLGDAERWLRERAHSLHLPSLPELSVDDFVARGLPGAPDRFDDPVGTRLAGFSARLSSGRRFAIKAAPRRAVGPDLSALFVGARGAFGRIESARLSALPQSASPAPRRAFDKPANPNLNADEAAAFERLRQALST
ncbi:MAG TPA: FAD-binding oxidoreductase [Polyangiaceae bacterium]|nr:FAD-binding oxidoreductase [Polyangiaceae bacterium]